MTLHKQPAPFDTLRVKDIFFGIFGWKMPDKNLPQPEPVEGRKLYVQRLVIGAALALAPVVAHAETIAVLQGLDKTTARVSKFDAPVDQSVRFGTLVITVRACVKKPPEEEPNTAAFLIIDEVRPGDANAVETKRVFSGWMFASSPAISALEDPIYDINVLDCKTDATSTPSSAPPSK